MKYRTHKQFLDNLPPERARLMPLYSQRQAVEAFNSLNRMEWPEIVDVAEVLICSEMGDRQRVGRTMMLMGYERYPCPTTKDGRWKLDGKRCFLYHRA